MGIFKTIRDKVFGRSMRQNTKYQTVLDNDRSLGARLKALAARYREANPAYFEAVWEMLVEADVPASLVDEILAAGETACRSAGVKDPAAINELIIDKIFIAYTKDELLETEIKLQPGLTILLVVGVNGVGKTTTIAKIARYYQQRGQKVLLAAGDTFRAAAQDQLAIWAERLGLEIVTKPPGSDPTSVMFDAVKKAQADGTSLLICDTAGRMHTKQNLMQELAKIVRVLGREVPGAPHEVLLVLDATTGQNGLVQAQEFLASAPLTGIVLTKMDGSSKGGIVLGIKDRFNLPVRFIGVGEGLDDLIEFDLEEYLVQLFSEASQ